VPNPGDAHRQKCVAMFGVDSPDMVATTVEALKIGAVLFAYFVLAPLVTVWVVLEAAKGRPKSFDRDMYWTVFVAAGAASGLIFVYVQRHANTLPGVVAYVGLVVSALLFGASGGFAIGAFVRKRDTLPPFVE
jgi:hypothetical protein